MPQPITRTTPHECLVLLPDPEVTSNWAVATAACFDPEQGIWMVTRVLVIEARRRGHGLGGQALDMLVEAVRQAHGQQLLVEPGGYNSIPASLERFYARHGFVKVFDDRPEMVFDLCPSL